MRETTGAIDNTLIWLTNHSYYFRGSKQSYKALVLHLFIIMTLNNENKKYIIYNQYVLSAFNYNNTNNQSS